jgi:hypothetical protein
MNVDQLQTRSKGENFTQNPRLVLFFCQKADERTILWYDTGVGGLVPRDESYVIVNYTVRTLGLKAGAFEGLPAFQLSTLETFFLFSELAVSPTCHLPITMPPGRSHEVTKCSAFGKLKTRRLLISVVLPPPTKCKTHSNFFHIKLK